MMPYKTRTKLYLSKPLFLFYLPIKFSKSFHQYINFKKKRKQKENVMPQKDEGSYTV